MNDHQIICGDCLAILPTLPLAKMIFADPPDNNGLKYDGGRSDSIDPRDYYNKMCGWYWSCLPAAEVVWWSVNARYIQQMYTHDGFVRMNGIRRGHDIRLLFWYFTFGQHRKTDCGNNYRPIFRIAPVDSKWHTDRIRIPSERQRLGDKRANPKGRVPGDVWGGPADVEGFCRIQGNNKERRKWHPTQHPEKLIERAILMSTDEGDLVIDPFMGTGTTLRVCQRLKRKCITIDVSETYCRKVSEETGVPVEGQA